MISIYEHLLTKTLKYNPKWSLNRRNFSAQIDAETRSKYESVVGLEVHAQIISSSKLFSAASCADGLRARANSCVSLFDASIPGTLPRLNRKCVESGVKTALALSCNINEISTFDRKHYFYADSPAGFQITQQRMPLATKGTISFHVVVPGRKSYQKSVRLHQLQLEQDSGKSLHYPELNKSLVDLNRAGVPLMELVFEPDLSDGEEAAAMVKELILILTRLNTCNCKMHEGALRVDANISINRKGEPLGVRTEVKNISSVRAIARAITHEIDRQIVLVESGGVVTNETRQWDAEGRKTILMRDKEVQQDYRFMPEPNLPPLNLNCIDGFDINEIKENLPEMPEELRQSLLNGAHGIQPVTATVLVNHHIFLNYFLDKVKVQPAVGKAFAQFLISDLCGALNESKIPYEECPLDISQVDELFRMQRDGDVTKNLVPLILAELLKDPSQSPAEVVEKNNWKPINDVDELTKLCVVAVAENPKLVKLYKKGREIKLHKEILKACNQRANMKLVVAILRKLIFETK